MEGVLSDYKRIATSLSPDQEEASDEDRKDDPKARDLRRSFLKAEDDLLAQAEAADPPAKIAAQVLVAETRIKLRHRSVIPLAKSLLNSAREEAAPVFLDSGRFSAGLRLPHRATKAGTYELMRNLQTLVSSAGPNVPCQKEANGDLCRSLALLLLLPAEQGEQLSSLADDLSPPDARADNDPRLINEAPLLQFVYDPAGARKAVGNTPVPPTTPWSKTRLKPDTARKLAAQSRDLESIRLGAAKIFEILWGDEKVRKILLGTGTTEAVADVENPPVRFLGAPTSSGGQSESILTLSLEDIISSRDRTFLLIKAGNGENEFSPQRWTAVELPSPGSTELWMDGVTAYAGALQRVRIQSDTDFLITQVGGSGGFLHAWMTLPVHRTSIAVAKEYYRGEIRLADIDGDGNPEFFLSRGLRTARFSKEKCNQCPRQRETVVFRLEGPKLVPVGRHTSWSDFYGPASSPFGMTARMAASVSGYVPQKELDQALSSIDTPSPIEPAVAKEKVHTVLDAIQNFIDGEDFTNALRYSEMLLGLSRRIPPFNERNLWLNAVAAFGTGAALTIGDVPKAVALNKQIVDVAGLNEGIVRTIQFRVAQATGDIAEQYKILRSDRDSSASRSEASALLTKYLIGVGNYQKAIESARSLVEEKWIENESAADPLYSEALSLIELGDLDSATVALTLILLHNPSQISNILLAATSIAIRSGSYRLARHLLDSGLAQAGGSVWSEQRSLALLMYGRLFRMMGNYDAADRLLHGALVATGSSAPLVAASVYDELATLYAQTRRPDLCRESSTHAFDIVIHGQANVAEEANKLSFVASREAIAATHIARLIEADRPAEELTDALEAWRAQVLRSLRRGAADVADVQPSRHIRSVIPDESAYVTFYVKGQDVWTVVYEGGGFRRSKLAITSARLDALRLIVQRNVDITRPEVKAAVWQDSIPPNFKAALTELYQGLIRPLKLSTRTKRIAIVPDEQLNWVPWIALNTNQDASQRVRPTVEDSAIFVAPSALLLGDRQPAKLTSFLAIYNGASIPPEAVKAALPDMFLNRSAPRLPELPSAQQEATDLANSLGDRISGNVLESGDFRVDSLAKSLSGTSLVHIAAHGIFNSINPMGSAVFLGGNSGNIVRPSDFAVMDLSKTELVSLSSCQTGASSVLAGAETMGFVRGLFLGGARAVVLGQWNVEDHAARLFFHEVYAGIKNGGTVSEAYRRAIATAANRYNHPLFWAGFTLYSTSP